MTFTVEHQLLSANEMQHVDQRALEQGVDTFGLMLRAGSAVADVVRELSPAPCHVLVLAGPGNNGGDGYISSEELIKHHYSVQIIQLGSFASTHSDAAIACARWRRPVISVPFNTDPLPPDLMPAFEGADVIVDALFGAGLSREFDNTTTSIIDLINTRSVKVVAVDVPSGLDGNTNVPQTTVVKADATISFYLAKPAHYLYPGRALCGELTIADIGLTHEPLFADEPACYLNQKAGFIDELPHLEKQVHKFDRGHVLVRGGPIECTGASRLSATTAIYSGAGLVTLATNSEALPIQAAQLTAVMLKRCDCVEDWQQLLNDERTNTVVIGPGNGLNVNTQQCVLQSLAANKTCVLDADALSCWTDVDSRNLLKVACHQASQPIVLTPHEGEFNRLFHDSIDVAEEPSKLHKARLAAKSLGVTIIYKGADTVIACPSGVACVNNHAPAWLATAGAGDVLAGLLGALLAQGMPPFEACCAAVWLHGEAAYALGYPMCAETLVPQVGKELGKLIKERDRVASLR